MAKILIVDDHPDMRDVFGQMLEMYGHTVEAAGTAELAWEKLRESLPDVMVIDQHLPGITGMELLTRVRRTTSYSGIRVILCSADDSEHKAAVRAGAQEFWLKGSSGIFATVEQFSKQLVGRQNESSSKPDVSRCQ